MFVPQNDMKSRVSQKGDESRQYSANISKLEEQIEALEKEKVRPCVPV